MAVSAYDETTQCVIKVEVGEGDDVTYKNRTFNYIAPNTTNDDFYTYLSPLGNFQTHSVAGIQRVDKFFLRDDG